MRGRSALEARLLLSVCVLCVCVSLVRAFYIPGVAPIEYEEGHKLEIRVSLKL